MDENPKVRQIHESVQPSLLASERPLAPRHITPVPIPVNTPATPAVEPAQAQEPTPASAPQPIPSHHHEDHISPKLVFGSIALIMIMIVGLTCYAWWDLTSQSQPPKPKPLPVVHEPLPREPKITAQQASQLAQEIASGDITEASKAFAPNQSMDMATATALKNEGVIKFDVSNFVAQGPVTATMMGTVPTPAGGGAPVTLTFDLQYINGSWVISGSSPQSIPIDPNWPADARTNTPTK